MVIATKRPKPKFQQITENLRQELFAANLTSAEWRFWIYLAVLDPFGDIGVEYDPAAIMVECGLSKSTYFAAKSKFQKLGWFDFKDGKTKFINLNGCAREESEKSESESEKSESSIYIDRVRDQTIQNNQTNSDSLPPTPQGGESENTFGFQIPEEGVSNSLASLELESESLPLTTNLSVRANVSSALAPQKIKYDAALGIRPPRQRAKYKYPDGPWLNEGGQMRAEFIRDRATLWRTGDTANSKAFGAMAIEDVEGLVCDHYMKPQNHAKLENDWNAFVSKNQRYVGNVQQRLAAGISINEVEQQKIIAIVPSLTAESVEPAYGSSSEAIDPVKLPQPRTIAQLESVATVDDDTRVNISQQMDELESQALAPEGADNPAAYRGVVKPEQRDFWANRHEAMVKSAVLNKVSVPEISESSCREVFVQLIDAKSMPKWDREKESQQKRPRTKLEEWNALLASGLPTVIADVERQARAQGYVVIDGQISEVDF